jgi:hypothetical protein
MISFEKLVNQMQNKGCISFSKMTVEDMGILIGIIQNTKLELLSKDDWQEIAIDMIRDGGSYYAG